MADQLSFSHSRTSVTFEAAPVVLVLFVGFFFCNGMMSKTV